MKFYTSDLHFHHASIISKCDRPFKSIDEMNNSMIERWNSRVTDKDEVFILGDFAFCKGYEANVLLYRLAGQKHLIVGNHDEYILDESFDGSLFQWISPYAVVDDEGSQVVLFHYPIAAWENHHKGAIHLYGHIHRNDDRLYPMLSKLTNAYNVGVDEWEYAPRTLEEIVSQRKKG
ncbi:MAG: hydrolase [Clostridiales bacterium]|nr:hydrolase [Clostridiales bacterium]